MDKLNFIKFDKTGTVYNLSQIVKIIPKSDNGSVIYTWQIHFVDGHSVYINDETYQSICSSVNPMVIK